MDVQVAYIKAGGGVVHRLLLLEGVGYTSEACNIDQTKERRITDEEALQAKRHCRRCSGLAR